MRKFQRGIALPFVLAVLLFIGLILASLIAAVREAANAEGQAGRVRAAIASAESLFEQARARLMVDPWHELGAEGLIASWNAEVPIELDLRAAEGNVEIHEGWEVYAPNRFAVFAGQTASTAGSTISGEVFESSTAPGYEYGGINLEAFEEDIEEELAVDSVQSRSFSSITRIRPPSGSATLIDITIASGVLIIEGDAVLQGTFTGDRREGWPLLVATGSLEVIGDTSTLQWTGLVAAGGDVVLRGSVQYTGTLIGKNVTLSGGTIATVEKSKTIRGFEPEIVRLTRAETWR